MTVPTEGLGPVAVRRLSLGAIASAAAHFRARGQAGDDALVDALIAEASQPLNRPADARHRRLEDTELERLSDDDRNALAAAVLALEGVATAADDVPRVARLMLARRYARIIGTSERVDQAVVDAVRPLAGRTDALRRTLSAGTLDAVAGQLAGSAALRELLKQDDWPERLRAQPDFALELEALLDAARKPPSPGDGGGQLPLFEADVAPASASDTRPGSPRTFERLATRIDDVAEAQRQLLVWHAETRHTIASGITDLAARAQDVDHTIRRLTRVAIGAAATAALALVVGVGAALWLRGELSDARARLAAAEQRHDADIAELKRLGAAQPAPRPATKAPARAPTHPAAARKPDPRHERPR